MCKFTNRLGIMSHLMWDICGQLVRNQSHGLKIKCETQPEC